MQVGVLSLVLLVSAFCAYGQGHIQISVDVRVDGTDVVPKEVSHQYAEDAKTILLNHLQPFWIFDTLPGPNPSAILQIWPDVKPPNGKLYIKLTSNLYKFATGTWEGDLFDLTTPKAKDLSIAWSNPIRDKNIPKPNEWTKYLQAALDNLLDQKIGNLEGKLSFVPVCRGLQEFPKGPPFDDEIAVLSLKWLGPGPQPKSEKFLIEAKDQSGVVQIDSASTGQPKSSGSKQWMAVRISTVKDRLLQDWKDALNLLKLDASEVRWVGRRQAATAPE
jgi:hypothetical protein